MGEPTPKNPLLFFSKNSLKNQTAKSHKVMRKVSQRIYYQKDINLHLLGTNQYLASFAPDFAELCGLITFRSGLMDAGLVHGSNSGLVFVWVIITCECNNKNCVSNYEPTPKSHTFIKLLQLSQYFPHHQTPSPRPPSPKREGGGCSNLFIAYQSIFYAVKSTLPSLFGEGLGVGFND
jgi:hypothetical protein